MYYIVKNWFYFENQSDFLMCHEVTSCQDWRVSFTARAQNRPDNETIAAQRKPATEARGVCCVLHPIG